MKISEMTDRDAIQALGEHGPEIARISREVLEKGRSSFVPKSVDPERRAIVMKRYGRNGISVYLLIQTWMKVQWRAHEGQRTNRDPEVTRVASWDQALDPTSSPTWKRALEKAGYGSEDPVLRAVWHDAGEVGMHVGSHHAKFLAAAMAGELAQMAPGNEPHFFLDMMPWVLMGHWPCGWDEERQRLKVY